MWGKAQVMLCVLFVVACVLPLGVFGQGKKIEEKGEWVWDEKGCYFWNGKEIVYEDELKDAEDGGPSAPASGELKLDGEGWDGVWLTGAGSARVNQLYLWDEVSVKWWGQSDTNLYIGWTVPVNKYRVRTAAGVLTNFYTASALPGPWTKLSGLNPLPDGVYTNLPVPLTGMALFMGSLTGSGGGVWGVMYAIAIAFLVLVVVLWILRVVKLSTGIKA
jgi:hypothetical protein